MSKEIIIMDASVAKLNARNPLEAGIFFSGFTDDKDVWGTYKKDSAKKYANLSEAINDARKLRVLYPDQFPPKVFELTINGNAMNLNDIKY
jgi:hypothetical protein